MGPPPNPGVARLTQRTCVQLVVPVRVVARGRASAGAAPACSSSHRFAAAGPSRSILRRYSALFLEKAACRSACETCRDGVVRGGALDLLSPGLSVTMSCRSEEHTSELQSLMRISYAVFCLKKKNTRNKNTH